MRETEIIVSNAPLDDLTLIGHDCMRHSEVLEERSKTGNVIKRVRVCRACSRRWFTTEVFKGFLTESTNEVEAKILRIITSVCSTFNVAEEDLLGPCRKRKLSFARQVGMYLAKMEGYSYPRIAKVFDRHHTTVMHGCQHIQKEIERDERLKRVVWLLQSKEVEAEKNTS